MFKLLLILLLIASPVMAEEELLFVDSAELGNWMYDEGGTNLITWKPTTHYVFSKPPFKRIKWIEETDTEIIIEMELVDDKERG